MIRQACMGVLLLMLGGCQLAGLLGEGTQKALYQLPKGKRVLVFVDTRPAVSAPPEFATQLADRLASHLYQNKAADEFVTQDRVLELRRDAVAFSKMGVADIARASGADVVVVVDVWDFTIITSSDNAVTEAVVQGLVKVVDRNGERLWPAGETGGMPVEARANPALTSDRNRDALVLELTDLLAVRAGRMFHSYALDDHEMTR